MEFRMVLLKQPKTKRGEETLQRICKSAEDLFAEKGYYNTQINDITQKADIASGTFYTYFPDKLSIFRYLLEDLGNKLRTELKLSLTDVDSLIESEPIGIRVFFKFVRKHIGLFQIVWQAQFVDPESFKEYYERFSRGYIRRIEKSQNEKLISQKYNPAHLAYYLMGIYNFTALKSFVFDDEDPDDEMIENIIQFINYGLKN